MKEVCTTNCKLETAWITRKNTEVRVLGTGVVVRVLNQLVWCTTTGLDTPPYCLPSWRHSQNAEGNEVVN